MAAQSVGLPLGALFDALPVLPPPAGAAATATRRTTSTAPTAAASTAPAPASTAWTRSSPGRRLSTEPARACGQRRWLGPAPGPPSWCRPEVPGWRRPAGGTPAGGGGLQRRGWTGLAQLPARCVQEVICAAAPQRCPDGRPSRDGRAGSAARLCNIKAGAALAACWRGAAAGWDGPRGCAAPVTHVIRVGRAGCLAQRPSPCTSAAGGVAAACMWHRGPLEFLAVASPVSYLTIRAPSWQCAWQPSGRRGPIGVR
jgi:hypothetical protein